MTVNLLPLLASSPQRILFAQASPPLVTQALANAREQLERHFPAVSWTTWREMLRQLQLDVLVNGNAVTFDWQALILRVQCLAVSMERPAPCPSTEGVAAAQLRAYRQQAVQALAELQATPHVVGPLLYALVTQLAQDHAGAVEVSDAAPGAGPHPANPLCPPGRQRPFPAPGPAVGPPGTGAAGTGLAPSGPQLPPPNPPGSVRRRTAPRRRTFRSIVERHPRPDGQVGFTVRELCATMHISAASVAHARVNPGHLSVEKVVALAEAMGECPLGVLLDLMTEASAKKRRKKNECCSPYGRKKTSLNNANRLRIKKDVVRGPLI